MPIFTLLVGITAVVLLASLVRRAFAAPISTAGAEEREVTRFRVSAAALGLLVAVAWLALAPSSNGRSLVLAPMLMGLTVLAGVVLGELVVRPRHLPAVREATLSHRTVREYLPRHFSRQLTAVSLGGLVLLTATVALASPDDTGRAGRSLDLTCSATQSSGHGPFPGSFYVAPYALGVLVALVVAVPTLRRVVRRRLGGTEAQAVRYRRAGVAGVLGSLGLVIASPLAGMAFFAFVAFTNVCEEAWLTLAGWGSLALVVLALAVAVTSLITVFRPLADHSGAELPALRSHPDARLHG